ncbi:MAG: tetratricopeptide repeat protein, partial [Candidatus Omnitrophica bacterium]|nr:tetratricopeptide repeat protein [Candidatus Omnitrophota bacterium]
MKPYRFVLIILVLVVFSPCLGFKFLHWDDYAHYISNPCVYGWSWHNICNLFGQTVNNTYVPLTTLSFNLEYHLFGRSALIAHLINILLHAAVVLLVLNFARRLGFTPLESFIAGVIFAVHPIHVESVAWVTERKDVLGVLFYILCLDQYWTYLQGNLKRHYGLSLLFGFLSILTKAMAVSLPLVLLLLDWFYRRPWRNTWLDKLPFAILIFPVASITLFGLSPRPDFGPDSILIGLWTFSWYLEKFFLPFGLLPIYTPPLPAALSNVIYMKALFVCALFSFAVFLCRKNRLFVFACLFWAATIFFFWRFDFADINIVADRFMYLPSLGLCLLLGKYLSKFKVAAALMAVILGYFSFHQCFIWRDDMTLWAWTLSHEPNNALAQEKQNAAVYYDPRRKSLDYKAMTQAIDKNPLEAQNYLDRGDALLQEGNYYLAFNDFNKAIKTTPLNYKAYLMRGQLYALKGDHKKALDDFNRSVALKPDNAVACLQKASVLGSMNDVDQAMVWFDKAIKINPAMAGAYYQRGLLYYKIGAFKDAVDDFTRAIALEHDLKGRYQRGKSYEALKQFDLAIEDFIKFLKADPYDMKALNELVVAYLMKGDRANALAVFNKSISLHPYNADGYNNRGIVYLQQKQYDAALENFTNAARLDLYPYHALITRGDIYFVKGERKKALDDYNS